MKKKALRSWLQALIILSPIPFGSMGGVWEPLCFLFVLLFVFFALRGEQAPYNFLYRRPLRILLVAFIAAIVFQLLPLPAFLLRGLSPGMPRLLESVSSVVPAFHALSWMPAATAMALARFLAYALFFVALLRIPWDKDDIMAIFAVTLVSGVGQTLFALMKKGQGNTKFFLFFFADDHVPGFLRGTIYNPDHFAFYLELLFPIALGLLFARLHLFDPGEDLREKILHVSDDRKLIVLFMVPVLLAAGIYLTGCRAGIAVLVLSTMFFAVMSVYLRVSFNMRKNLRLIFILGLLLAVFIGLQNTVDKFVAKGLFESTGRVEYWANAWRMFREFPAFGTGLGTFPYAYFLYGSQASWVSHAHNEFVETLSDLGIVGTVLFFSLLGLLAFSLLRMWIARRHPEIKPVVLGVLTALFAAWFHSLFDFSLRIPANAFLFIVLFALGMKLAAHKRDFTNESK